MLRPKGTAKLGSSGNGGLPLFTHGATQRSRDIDRCIRVACFSTAAFLLLAFLYVSLWWNSFVFPATIAQASRWTSRTQDAKRAVQAAPLLADSVGLVVARFSGNLSWVPAVQQLMHVTETTVYCKNPRAQPAVVGCSHSLPNVGNEGHTYLHHIVQHWDTLPDLLLFLPDTVEYGDKLKTWRRVKRNMERYGRRIYYADDHTPVTGLKFFLNYMNEVFYGVNFPCKDHRRGGTDCVYFGHTDGVNPTGRLVPADPPDFYAWLDLHLEHTQRRHIRRCGWGNRGMVIVSKAAIQAHSRHFYANILEQLSKDVFPMSGMFMERLWRRVWLCSTMEPGGGHASARTDAGDLEVEQGEQRSATAL